MLVITFMNLRNYNESQLKQFGEVVVENFEKNSKEYLLTYDYFRLRSILRESEYIENLVYAAVYNDVGQLIAYYPSYETTAYHLIEKYVGLDSNSLTAAVWEEKTNDHHLIIFDRNVYSTPSSRPVGKVRIALSRNEAFLPLHNVLNKIILLGFALILMLIGCLSWSLNMFTKPMTALSRICQKISLFSFDDFKQIRPTSPEVETLMNAFTNMSKRLLEQERQLNEQQMHATIGKIAAQVAHDIRSPLTALKVVSGHLAELPEEKRVMIRNAVQRIDDIANDLAERRRATAKKETDETILAERTSVQLLSSLIEPLISEKRIQYRSQLSVHIESRLDANSYGLFAAVQPVEFKRILSNLINNAVEALGNKGKVLVALHADGEKIGIRLEDDGPGIPAELLPKLMQRGATFGKSGGTGLGLAHARETVEEWGGSLTIESRVGEGTAIHLTLHRSAAPSWFVPELGIHPGTEVVIVDDDASIHNVWQERFDVLEAKRHGISLHHFSSGREIKQLPATDPPSLFLCDYELLGEPHNGLDLIEQLGLQQNAILVTSRYEEDNVRTRCAQLGVQLIPKALAGSVPIRIVEKRPTQASAIEHLTSHIVDQVSTFEARCSISETQPKILVIDDDKGIRLCWKFEREKLMLGDVVAYASMEECESSGLEYTSIDIAFVDKHIEGSTWDVTKTIAHLKERGVKKVIVASGDPAHVVNRHGECNLADGFVREKIPDNIAAFL